MMKELDAQFPGFAGLESVEDEDFLSSCFDFVTDGLESRALEDTLSFSGKSPGQ